MPWDLRYTLDLCLMREAQLRALAPLSADEVEFLAPEMLKLFYNAMDILARETC